MTIAFYKVGNSLGYGRDTFNTNRSEAIIEKLQLLPEEEVKFYDADKYDWQSKSPTLADFETDYNDEELDNGWWCVVLNTECQVKKPALESMISAQTYDEIVSKVKETVGEDSFEYIFPAVKKALEEGSGSVREEILRNWLDVDYCRVCSYCGAIMEEGWYLNANGYACSDECAAESEGITMEQFGKWRIYKDDIEYHLKLEGKGRKIEDLTKEECDEIIDRISDDLDYYYTEWS